MTKKKPVAGPEALQAWRDGVAAHPSDTFSVESAVDDEIAIFEMVRGLFKHTIGIDSFMRQAACLEVYRRVSERAEEARRQGRVIRATRK